MKRPTFFNVKMPSGKYAQVALMEDVDKAILDNELDSLGVRVEHIMRELIRFQVDEEIISKSTGTSIEYVRKVANEVYIDSLTE